MTAAIAVTLYVMARLAAAQISPSLPTALNTNAATDAGGDVDAQISTDGLGNWVAAWYSTDTLDGMIGTDSDILVSRSTNNGTTWSAPAPLNSNAATDSGGDVIPQITTDGLGNWVAVWYSTDTLDGMIGTDSDILVSRSTNNGTTWSAPAPLNSNAAIDSGGDVFPQITTDGLGNWVAVWQSTDNLNGTVGFDNDILVSRSTNNGATWTTPTALNTNAATDGGEDWDPHVTTDSAGNWIAVWYFDEGIESDILVSRSTNNGATWTTPAALNTNAATDSGNDFSPRIATDGLGNWVAVWSTNDSLGGTIGTEYDILVARSIDNGATWTDPAALNSNATTDSGGDGDAQVSTDGTGNWVAVWTSVDTLGETIGTDYDILVSRSMDNGVTWTAPAALNANAATDSGEDGVAQISTDGVGNWISVWLSTDTLDDTIGADADILFTRWFLPVVYLGDLFVDFGSVLNGIGTEALPLKNLSDAVDIANSAVTIWIKAGSSAETFIGPNALGKGNQLVTLRKNGIGGAPVRIGVQ